MLPRLALVPHALVHLLASATILVALVLWVRRHPTARRGAMAVFFAGLCGILLALVTAPRAHGSASFALLLSLSWSLFAVGPVFLATMAVVLARGHRWARWAFGLVAGSLVLVSVRAFCIEPAWLETTHYQIRSDQVERPLRIAVVADLQTDAVGPYERETLTTVMSHRPDLILFPGDLIQHEDGTQYAKAWGDLRRLFEEVDLDAPLGVYATRGDVDWRELWPSQLDGTIVQPLGPGATTRRLRPDLSLTGLGLAASADPEATVPAAEGFHVTFGHRPGFALGRVQADLLLAGHTHGGQVQVPGLGPIITLSKVPRSWASGRTDLPDGSTLIVSRGVGMERGVAPRLRLFCRPQVVIIDVLPERG